jgi:hypothetical protein
MSRIAICIPHSYENFQKPFTKSLLGLVSAFYIYNQNLTFRHSLEILIQDEGWIDFMRERLSEVALEQGFDYILWLDTDMTFPPKTIQMMLERFEEEPELEAVTGLYTYKTPPFMPHLYTTLDKEKKFRVAGAFSLKEPIVVEGAGFGCLMMKTSLLKRTPKPWFEFRYPTPDRPGAGEDLQFFLKANPVQMICDPNIKCLHYRFDGYGVGHYLDYNNLLVENDIINASQEQIDSIAKKLLKPEK